MVIEIVEARTRAHVAAARELILEYARSLDFTLEFQAFDREISDLPGEYRPPKGALLLAVAEGRAIGCVALRRIDERVCEMKRLYTVPDARGQGAGRALAEAVIGAARRLGYRVMRLDTVRRMTEANALYASLGFCAIPPYRHNPLEDACYFELDLGSSGRASPAS